MAFSPTFGPPNQEESGHPDNFENTDQNDHANDSSFLNDSNKKASFS